MVRGLHKQPAFLVVVTGSLAALLYLQARTLAAAGVHPAWMLLAQALVAGGGLWLVAVRRGRLPLDGRHVRFYLLAGLTGLTLPNLAGFMMLRHVDAATYALLVVLAPLVTWVLSTLYERRRAPGRRLLGVVSGLLGALIVLVPALKGAGDTAPGLLVLGLLVPLLLAAGNLYRARAVPRATSSSALGGGSLLLQLPIALLLVAALPGADLPPTGHLPGLFRLGMLTLLTYLPFYQLQKRADAVAFSHIGYVILIVSSLGSAVLLGTALPAGWPLAAALVVFALVLNQPGPAGAGAPRRPLQATQPDKEISAMNKPDNCHRDRYRRALALALASAMIPPARLLEELECPPRKAPECCRD